MMKQSLAKKLKKGKNSEKQRSATASNSTFESRTSNGSGAVVVQNNTSGTALALLFTAVTKTPKAIIKKTLKSSKSSKLRNIVVKEPENNNLPLPGNAGQTNIVNDTISHPKPSDPEKGPSKPPSVRNINPVKVNLPEISVQHVDIPHSRTNRPASKEGFLNKKIDFDQKSTSLAATSGGWKVYRVILRGSKLYFYKPPSEAILKTFFENKDFATGNEFGSTLSPIIENERGMRLNSKKFNANARALIFEGGSSFDGNSFTYPLISRYCYGEVFCEVDRSMRFKKHVCLLIFEDNVVICKCKWLRYTLLKFGSGGNHLSSNNNVAGISTEGQNRDTKSDQDGSANDKPSKGYFTKWKLDSCYPIHNVDVIPDPNLASGYSPYIVPSSQPNYFSKFQRVNDDASSMKSFSSSVSAIPTGSSTSSSILYLSIVHGEQEHRRIFLSNKRNLWATKLFAAKEASLRKMVGTKPASKHSGEKYGNGITEQLNDVANKGDKTDLATVAPTARRGRAFWGTDRHPELVIKELVDQQQKSEATSDDKEISLPIEAKSQRLICGGSVDSLVHELVFQTQKGSQDNDDYLHTFLLTYPLFTEVSYVCRELYRCASMQSSLSEDDERFQTKAISKQLIKIFTTWCNSFGADVAREEVLNEILEVIEKVLIKENIEGAEDLKDLVYTTRAKIQALEKQTNEHDLGSEASIANSSEPSTLDLSNLLVTGLTPALFLKMAPEELAQQLYLYHFNEFRKYDPTKYLKSFIPTKQQRLNSSVIESPLNFNSATPHFITKLIYHHLLIATQQSAYKTLRSALLTHWICTGSACKALGDMVGWMAIASGICSPGIIRLEETWKRVKSQWRNIVTKDWIPILLKYGGLDGNINVESTNALLPTSEERSKTRPIPYFGFITLFLEQQYTSVPAFVDRPCTTNRQGSRSNSITGAGIINFEKYWKMYDTIKQGLSQLGKDEDAACPFTSILPLQKYFHHLNTIPAASSLDAWQLFESSLICEPCVHGQYLEHNVNQRKSHSAYFPLLFTEVIPSSCLFERKAFLDASGTLDRKSSNSSINHPNENPVSTPSTQGAVETYPPLPSHGQNNLAAPFLPRKRTSSFPTAKIGPLTSTTWNTGLDLVTRNWLGGFVQLHSGDSELLRSMKDIAGVDELLLFVKDGELIFKSVKDATRSRPPSIVESPPSQLAGTTPKRNSNNPLGSIDRQDTLIVVKAGTLERLLDVLINGVATYSTSVVDDNSEPPLTIARQGQLTINLEEYMSTFFATYRSFCSASMLLDNLKKRFMNARNLAKETMDQHSHFTTTKQLVKLDSTSDSAIYDWKTVAKIQNRILAVFEFWIREAFHDFLDDLTLKNRMMHFIDEFKAEVDLWSSLATDNGISTLAQEVKDSIIALKGLAHAKSLGPACDIQDERLIELFDDMIKIIEPICHPESHTVDLSGIDNLIDTCTISDLLDRLDLIVLGIFESVTQQDWILAFETLETQSADIMGWYLKKQTNWVPDDEPIISDIFMTLTHVSWTRNPKEYLINALPKSIQALCRLHAVIYKWVISEITSSAIDCQQRAKRIDILLSMVSLSRERMAKMDIYPKEDSLENNSTAETEARRSVPSFVESAIVGGLISPESRLFARSWIEVAIARNSSFETLESLLHGNIVKTDDAYKSNSIDVRENTLVPCIGWLFERMLEICCNIPNMSFESEKLINFDKRRYVYNLIQIFVRSQHDLLERACKRKPSVDFEFLISDNSHSGIPKSDLRALKEIAVRENNASHRIANPLFLGRSLRPFSKLINEEQEKLKRDQKERERLEKSIRDTRHKMQKQEARLNDKRSHDQQAPRKRQNPAISKMHAFIKIVRPLSMAFQSSLYSSTNNSNTTSALPQSSYPALPPGKAALVINLINSLTSIEYGFTQRESVFRIVSEEGGQYLFQALDDDDMHEWIRVITEAAKSGAAKRHTVFENDAIMINEGKEVEIPVEQSKTRNSVYGKELSTLMENGEIPIIVEKCINEIEKRGLEDIGIYRIPGSQAAINDLRAAFNSDAQAVDLSSEEYSDINIIAGALKLFFRSLPEPLLTLELYNDFIQAAGLQDRDEQFYAIKDLLQRLPKPNYDLLKRLIEHLEKITDYEDSNHMYAHNLAIVFGPTLFPNSFQTLGNLGIHNSIVRNLILRYHWFFNVEEEATEIELPEYSDREIGENDEFHQFGQSEIPLSDDNYSMSESENNWEAEAASSVADTYGGESLDEGEFVDNQQVTFEEYSQADLYLGQATTEEANEQLFTEHQNEQFFSPGNPNISDISKLTDVIEDPEGESE